MNPAIQDNLKALIDSRKSLILASLNNENLPEASATPFLKSGDRFYIFISDLASHTQNIKQNPKLSIMLIEDELEAKNAFARKRLSYECQATIIEKTHANWAIILDKFEEKQGKTVSMLKLLPDFHLVELTTISGNYIEGFGKAYRLTGEGLQQAVLQTGK